MKRSFQSSSPFCKKNAVAKRNTVHNHNNSILPVTGKKALLMRFKIRSMKMAISEHPYGPTKRTKPENMNNL